MTHLLIILLALVGIPLSGVAAAQTIELRQMNYQISRTGRIDFRHSTHLSFKTAGYISAIHVDEGYIVNQGEVLSVLDITDLDAQATAARAQLERAEAELTRGQSLHASQLISNQALEQLSTAVQNAQSKVELLAFDISRSTIVAPFQAVVVKRLANPGQHHQPGEPIFTIAALSNNLIVRVDLTEEEINKVKLGLPARITLNNGEQFAGIIGKITARANQQTGMFSIEIDIDDNHAVIAGQWARVEILPESAL